MLTDFMGLGWKDKATVIQSRQHMFSKIIAEDISDLGRDGYLALRVLELQTDSMIREHQLIMLLLKYQGCRRKEEYRT